MDGIHKSGNEIRATNDIILITNGIHLIENVQNFNDWFEDFELKSNKLKKI